MSHQKPGFSRRPTSANKKWAIIESWLLVENIHLAPHNVQQIIRIVTNGLQSLQSQSSGHTKQNLNVRYAECVQLGQLLYSLYVVLRRRLPSLVQRSQILQMQMGGPSNLGRQCRPGVWDRVTRRCYKMVTYREKKARCWALRATFPSH